jgi:hypothetical protein
MDDIVAYPMVEEDQATGRVADVYADLLAAGMPFVPSVFKSLAVCPAYLVLAHDQAAGVLEDSAFNDAAQELVTTVGDASRPPEDRDARAALAGFVAPLARMLVVTSGLCEALDGRLDAPPAQGRRPRSESVQLERTAPATGQVAQPELLGEIRAALRTPVVNTIWRSLAASGQLPAAWSALAPQVHATRPAADRLQGHARTVAARLPWQAAASPEALAQAGVGDAAPGVRSILTAYLVTLPRVLTLVASTQHG